MNKVYKLIWNATLNTWVAVSELAKGKKKASKVTGIISTVVLVLSVSSGAQSAKVELGDGALATDTNGVAVGISAKAEGVNAVAYGTNANASGERSTAISHGATSSSTGSIAIGISASASTITAIALGAESNASGERALAIGGRADASGQYSIAQGLVAIASGTNTIATGYSANASGTNSIATGYLATAAGANSVALGANTKAGADSTVAIGNTSNASAAGSVVIGTNTVSTGNFGLAIGYGANVVGTGSLALGNNAKTGGQQAVAIGMLSNAATSSAVIGYSAKSIASGVALGESANAGATYAVSIGRSSKASGVGSLATGYKANASGIGAIAQGENSVASADTSIALGGAAIASLVDSVAIGAASLTQEAVATKTMLTANDVVAADPVVSFGNDTVKRRLQNIADGADGNDAVNVNQLKASQSNIASIIGDSAKVDADTGVISVADIGGITNANTIDDAFKAVLGKNITFAGTTGDTTKKLDETLSITGANGNITTDAGTDGLKIALANNLDLTTAGSLKFGTGTTLNNTGLTIAGGPSLTTAGLNMDSKKITNVAAGVITTDGVNLGQVLDLQTSVKHTVGGNTIVSLRTTAEGQTEYTVNSKGTKVAVANNSGLAVNESYDAATLMTTYGLDLTKELKDKIESGAAGGELVNKGIKFTGTTGDTTKKLDETLSIAGSNSNITTAAGTDGLKISLADTLALTSAGSLTVGNSKLDNTGLVISGGPKVVADGIDAGGKKITGVANGTTQVML